MSLQVSEIYVSVQGEAQFAGWPCAFIRLTGCPLRCRWCDTVYSFQGGTEMQLNDIIKEVKGLGVRFVELTGGEPLAQPRSAELMQMLLSEGFRVMIETGGSEPLNQVPKDVHIIMDIKCPGSGMSDRNRWENLTELKPTDEIKFVIADRHDYEWAKALIKKESLSDRFQVLLSAAFGLLSAKQLVEWMLEDKLNCRLNLQQHKFIWSPRAKGV